MSFQDFALGTRAAVRPYHDAEDAAGRRVRQVLRITRDLRELFPGSSGILDIAAGGGEAVSWYRSLFPGVRLVCLEGPTAKPRPTVARFAAIAHFRRFDGAAIPYADASFDVITGYRGLSATPEDRRAVLLLEAYRVLKPGGLIVLFEPKGAGLAARTLTRTIRDVGFHDAMVRYDGPLPLLPIGVDFHVVAFRP
ncbi:ubiquinone/menaquinone biosynthesis C-methylase UbiE [Skermanella aerolata]|uniref:class I SAM-dependent methyltransferase n=1 Tax=Skermanella aerolata TaxID=393310 RepID=UPI003D21BD25